MNFTTQEFSEDIKVGEIAAQDWRNAKVLKDFGLDFCCGGKKSLTEACAEKGISRQEVEQKLTEINLSSPAGTPRFYDWNLDFLCNYIEENHHKYVRDALLDIGRAVEKVARVHGKKHPYLIEVRELFNEIEVEMLSHMEKEEQILFPYIRELVQSRKFSTPHFGTVQNPITMMEKEHESAAEIMEKISSLTDGYTAPQGACNTFCYLYDRLEDFEGDLHQHVHLENNILFPKASQLEREARSRNGG